MTPPDQTMKFRLTLGGNAAFLRFYGELNDFLAPERSGRTLVHRFDVSPSIKDAIESIGVPHPEVELMVANHEPVDFSYSVQPGDYISVYPTFHSIDVGRISRASAEVGAASPFCAGCASRASCGLSSVARLRRTVSE